MLIERGKWLIQFIEQYSQLFQRCNWYTYEFARIEIEDDRALGGIDIVFVILGLGIRVRWNYQETEKMREIRQSVDNLWRCEWNNSTTAPHDKTFIGWVRSNGDFPDMTALFYYLDGQLHWSESEEPCYDTITLMGWQEWPQPPKK